MAKKRKNQNKTALGVFLTLLITALAVLGVIFGPGLLEQDPDRKSVV